MCFRPAAVTKPIRCACGTLNPPESKKCRKCGSSIASDSKTSLCPNCGAQNPLTATVCKDCNSSLEKTAGNKGPNEWSNHLRYYLPSSQINRYWKSGEYKEKLAANHFNFESRKEVTPWKRSSTNTQPIRYSIMWKIWRQQPGPIQHFSVQDLSSIWTQ